MKIKKYIIGILGVLFFMALSCNDESINNPELSDADLKVYFWGEGDNVTGIAWEGYDVLIGETLDLKLQVSPKEDTSVKWVDDETGEVLSENLKFTYAPTQEESRRVNFIATRLSGYEKKVVFNFRGNLDGFTSKINEWQSVLIPQGTQTGTFSVEFDMIPSKDNMDGIVGVLDGVATTYSNNSCIVRLNPSGKIDAYNDTGYAFSNELEYHAGLTYHVKMDIDAVNMSYDIYANQQGGEIVEIGKDFKFRRKITHLDYWSMVAGDFNLSDPGTHRVLNMQITTLTENQAPIFIPVDDVVLAEGVTLNIDIEAVDPLGENIVLEASNLPRFATFIDRGFGKGTITFSPYNNCGGCDVGLYDIEITGANSVELSKLNFTLEVLDPNAGFDILVDLADATLWDNGNFDPGYHEVVLGHTGAGEGGDGHVAGVLPFALPEVPTGKKIKSAILKLNITHNSVWFPVEYDIYGISSRTTPDILASDFFAGPYDTDPSATAIQKAFLTHTTVVGNDVEMDNVSGIELASFMNSQYVNGASAGEFVFIRINPNRIDMPTWAQLNFQSGQGTLVPVLTVVLENE
ncbi:hypothetical protein AAFN75_13535 [Algibacter sp. AS12]|uniref:hypothetical protein n=1 Tax=Algibacter sp. AS12 TaxID=3135773 RepID=UPI00398A6C79